MREVTVTINGVAFGVSDALARGIEALVLASGKNMPAALGVTFDGGVRYGEAFPVTAAHPEDFAHAYAAIADALVAINAAGTPVPRPVMRAVPPSVTLWHDTQDSNCPF